MTSVQLNCKETERQLPNLTEPSVESVLPSRIKDLKERTLPHSTSEVLKCVPYMNCTAPTSRYKVAKSLGVNQKSDSKDKPALGKDGEIQTGNGDLIP